MLSKQRRLIAITAAFTIIWFALLAVMNGSWQETLPLVLFIFFSCSAEVGRYFMHWLLAPFNLIFSKVGSIRFYRFSRLYSGLL
jgi:hypothetical protein